MKSNYIIGVVLTILTGFLLALFYSPNERYRVYLTVIVLFVIINIIVAIFVLLRRKLNINNTIQTYMSYGWIGYNVLILVFSFFQFNYVIMPYAFRVYDPFPYGYAYKDLKDDVRIEYYARNYYGRESVYRESYDKNEIKAFLDLFKDIETTTDYEGVGNPDVFMDWDNDIHVMIRNMDNDDSDRGYYVMFIDLVDSSDYALKVREGGTTVVYEVPEELRTFIIDHLLLDE